jgi:Contractile injection system tube protein/LysM domain
MLVKAFLTRKDKHVMVVPCLFNPKELNVEKSNHFAEVNIPGLSSPIFQFVRGNARSVTMDLFFDTYEQGTDVRLFTDVITGWDAGSMFSNLPNEAKGLMDIDSDLHAPPICIFIWGAFIFQCIIEKVSKRFTMFLPEGIPVRATLNITLKEYREVEVQVKEMNTQSSDLTKSWVVTQGDSLWAIAAKEYGNPEDWRLIAKKNNIENPRILNPGQRLIIPVKE